jgi:hypothetical protein
MVEAGTLRVMAGCMWLYLFGHFQFPTLCLTLLRLLKEVFWKVHLTPNSLVYRRFFI